MPAAGRRGSAVLAPNRAQHDLGLAQQGDPDPLPLVLRASLAAPFGAMATRGARKPAGAQPSIVSIDLYLARSGARHAAAAFAHSAARCPVARRPVRNLVRRRSITLGRMRRSDMGEVILWLISRRGSPSRTWGCTLRAGLDRIFALVSGEIPAEFSENTASGSPSCPQPSR